MATERKNYDDTLCIFRGLAALLVAFGHLEQVFVRPYTSLFSAYAGLLAQASVMVFFVISGYSITASIEGLIDKPNPCYQYFLKRFFRVIPPLITVLFLMYWLSAFAPGVFANGINNFISEPNLARKGLYFDFTQALGALFFLNGFLTATPGSNGPLWSLSFEVWLYLIFFKLYYAVYKRVAFLFVFALILYIALIFLDKSGSSLFFKYSCIWFLGAACRLINESNYKHQTRYSGLIKCFFVISILITLFVGYRCIRSNMKIDISAFNISVGVSFFSYLLGNFRWALYNSTIALLLKKAANFSYTLYLIHFPVYLFIFGITQDRYLLNPAVLCLIYFFTILVSYFLSKFSEKRYSFINLFTKAQ